MIQFVIVRPVLSQQNTVKKCLTKKIDKMACIYHLLC